MKVMLHEPIWDGERYHVAGTILDWQGELAPCMSPIVSVAPQPVADVSPEPEPEVTPEPEPALKSKKK
jgi:hypothetical protein